MDSQPSKQEFQNQNVKTLKIKLFVWSGIFSILKSFLADDDTREMSVFMSTMLEQNRLLVV